MPYFAVSRARPVKFPHLPPATLTAAGRCSYVKAYIDKGNVSLAITSVFMLLGFILVNGPDNPKDITYEK